MISVFLFFILITLIYFLYLRNNIELFASDKIYCYCINLEDNTDRWDLISKQQKNLSFTINKINAVDTRNDWMKYSNEITKESLIKLQTTEKTKLRLDHADLTPGAIGCFLSHLKIYKIIQEKHNHDDNILIIEDDNLFVDNFNDKIKKAISLAPKDWDVILFDYIDNESIDIDDNYKKIKKFYLTNCYLISYKGVQKILNNHKLIYNQIDSYLSDLSQKNILNIYAHKEKLAHQRYSYTNIQVYGVK